ncbi:hypothetical protein K402DRAFT_320603 [Aulographum hederae CBS 113979]|uniref:Uncharacterized protein n=1 Tax=Aulographum hederae CBS 113979 TaxID=1176131 RepID=A0A6G1HGV7_9PEZI|nr:hypothetical protein K402DRAFT_320603 [Aulographum hederae CBS 113979]
MYQTPGFPSQPAPQLTRRPSIHPTFASISLHDTDKIRLLKFPAGDVAVLQDLIARAWRLGIQKVRNFDAAHEIKVRGNPWVSSSWGEDKVAARRLMCGMLAELWEMGWVVNAIVEVGKRKFDKDTLIFRKQEPPPPSTTWFIISFDRGDTLRIIDGSLEVGAIVLRAFDPEKIRKHTVTPDGSVFEIKFRGYPWRAMGTETVQARLLILTLMECLEQLGYLLYASLDLEDGHEGGDADVWFCCEQRDRRSWLGQHY